MAFELEYILSREKQRLREWLKSGIDPAYDDFHDFLYDFFPDFSWNDDRRAELKWLLDDPEWVDLATQIRQLNPNHDFIAAVTEAVEKGA